MYAVGDTHSHMSSVGDGGGEEDLCHVPLLSHLPLGTCVTKRPPLCIWQRPSPPLVPVWDIYQRVSPTEYRAQILLFSPITH